MLAARSGALGLDDAHHLAADVAEPQNRYADRLYAVVVHH